MFISTIKKQAANFLTLISMVLGLSAIIQSIEGNFKISAVLIVIASVFDYSDGFVARKLNIVTKFGKYFDTNSDLISFGIAPGLLVYLSVLNQFNLTGLLVSFLFISGCVFRLSRYNATEFSGFYVGVPITIAGLILALSLFLNSILPPVIYLLLTLGLTFLMVSNYSVKKI